MQRGLLFILVLFPVIVSAQITVLDEYVYPGDSLYSYTITAVHDSIGYDIYRIRMISGTWLDSTLVDTWIWEHDINVYVPDVIKSESGFVLIVGGSIDSNPVDPDVDAIFGQVAIESGTVLAGILQVPMQPLTFTDEIEERSEDEIIAYGWAEFLLDTTNTEWICHLPMTRASVRTLDVVQDLMSDIRPDVEVNDFFITGASKRGWTTWLVAAAENGPLGQGRVSSVLPIVIDVLSVKENLIHHFDVYGFWSFALDDYFEMGIMDWLYTPEFVRLNEICDPYEFLERYTMPKFVVNASGDEFFLPDSWRFYYDDLPDPKWLRYVPNVGHSMENSEVEVLVEMFAVYCALAAGDTIPEYSWEILEDNTIMLETAEEDIEVTLWQATNPDARDFRDPTVGDAWWETTLEDQGGGVYLGIVDPPEEGWKAYLVDVKFNGTYTFSSGIGIISSEQSVGDIETGEAGFILLNMYPNPASSPITANVNLGTSGYVEVSIYDISGRCVAVIPQGELEAGIHPLIWDLRGEDDKIVSSGVYFMRIDAGNQTVTEEFVILN